jgi:probable lipoprotein NlpC
VKMFLNSFFYIYLFVGLLFAPQVIHAAVIAERDLRGLTPAQARLQLLATAESFLGIPYRWAGIDRRGMDCSGFVYASFRYALGYTIPRTSLGMYHWAQRIPTAQLQPGDFVFFITVGTRVSHVGIYVGGGRFIHSASDGPRTGVIISRLDESFWRRTYSSAGRALPWDAQTARDMASARDLSFSPGGFTEPVRSPRWGDSGFFAGAGASWNWGGGGEGAPAPFRSVSFLGMLGYSWSSYQLALEMRPQWDSFLHVFRLPLTLSLGTDHFQIFAGPAFVFGEPRFDLEEGLRHYQGGWGWLWEAGFSAAFAPIRIGRGGLSFFGEVAWQSYQAEEQFRFRPDVAASLRLSTGIRYLWRL